MVELNYSTPAKTWIDSSIQLCACAFNNSLTAIHWTSPLIILVTKEEKRRKNGKREQERKRKRTEKKQKKWTIFWWIWNIFSAAICHHPKLVLCNDINTSIVLTTIFHQMHNEVLRNPNGKTSEVIFFKMTNGFW